MSLDSASAATTATTTRVRVWDLPTRLFHWVLAATMVGSVVSAKVGGNAMVWHFRFGYVVFTLLLFRLLWGFLGGHWSRFSSFIYSPGTILRYLRGQPRPDEHLDVGHNPLGSFSVFGLLTFLAIQVGTGLLADDEIASIGPLNKFVSSTTASTATGWHKSWGQWILLTMVALHIGAILYYRFARQKNLVRPMLVGDKHLPAGTPAALDGVSQRMLAAGLGVACAVLVSWVVSLGG